MFRKKRRKQLMDVGSGRVRRSGKASQRRQLGQNVEESKSWPGSPRVKAFQGDRPAEARL